MKMRKQSPIDADHLRMLHREAVEQLELMRSVYDAACHTFGVYRDNLYNIVLVHWQSYLDIIHMLCMHDEKLNNCMQQVGLHEEKIAENANTIDSQQSLASRIIPALICRHRRFDYYLTIRGTPMTEYLQVSINREKEHLAQLISILDSML